MFNCQVCKRPCSALSAVEYHPEWWIEFQEFIRNDFIPLIRKLGEEQPLLTLYAIDPEFRRDLQMSMIRE